MRKNLILITNHFPYGSGEAFLENEFPFLHKSFEHITIVSRTNEKRETRQLPSDVNVIKYPAKANVLSIIISLRSLFINMRRYTRIIKEEQRFIKKTVSLTVSLSLWRSLLHDLLKAIDIKSFISKNISSDKDDQTVVYSYWQNNAALALALLKHDRPKLKNISRAHGSDLYFYVHNNMYLSFRNVISKQLDHLFFIAEDGMKYQQEILGLGYDNFSVSRLGTLKRDNYINKQTSKGLRFVSCSSLIPLKRVHLIIEILNAIGNISVEWVHFGNGKLEREILDLAKQKLNNNNITYDFKGFVSNTEIHKYYAANDVDLFINVSETEGVPVSIMEAMSYGIPVLATDVGGTSEIVNRTCGILIDKDFNPKIVAEQIICLATDIKLRSSLSKGANIQWRDKYSAESNYNVFLQKVLLD